MSTVIASRWKQRAQKLDQEARVLYFVFKHPRTPRMARWVAACATAYSFSPIQLIPNFIPLIGFLDDFVVFFLGAKLIQRITPPDVRLECRELADTADFRGEEDTRPGIARYAFALTVASWLLGTVAASALVAAYIHR